MTAASRVGGSTSGAGCEKLRAMNAFRLMLVAAVIGLGGCTLAAVAIVDNALSNAMGQECMLARAFKETSICRDAFTPPVPPDVYCYRTLGGVDCYATADPYGRERMGHSAAPQPLGG